MIRYLVKEFYEPGKLTHRGLFPIGRRLDIGVAFFDQHDCDCLARVLGKCAGNDIALRY